MNETNPPGDAEKPDAEPTPAAIPPAPQAAPNAPAPKVKKRRRWPWIVGAIGLVLLGLVLIIPTIVSTGAGRSLVVSQVNQRINGRLQIQDLSLGWASGIRVDGLVIYDATGRQILQLPHFSTGLTILKAIRGNYDLGKTDIDGLDVLVSREADGSLNWEHLAKSSASSTPAAPAERPTSSERPSSEPAKPKLSSPTKVPPVRGDVALNNCTITYEDRSPQPQPAVYLRSVQANIKIPDINQTITNSLSANAQIGSAPPGVISMVGSVAAVKNNLLAINSASVDQTLTLKGLDLAAVSALLGPDLKLAGVTDGQVVLKLTNGTDGAIQASVLSKGFAAGGKTLNGASLKSEALTFQTPTITVLAPQGITDLATMKVLIGDGHTPLTAQLKNASIINAQGPGARQVLTGYTLTFNTAGSFTAGAQGRDVKLSQLDLTDNQGIVSLKKSADQDVVVSLPTTGNPAANGTIAIQADLKRLNDCAQALQTVQVVAKDPSGMELRSGKLDGRITLAHADNQTVKLTGNFGLTQLTVADATSSPVKDESVTLLLEASANHDLSRVNVSQLHATGDLFTTEGSADLKLSNGSDPKAPPVPLLQKVQKANFAIKAPSLQKLQLMARAFSPPKPTTAPAPAKAGAPPAPAELPPADITSGSATITLTIDGDGKKLTITPGASLADLAFKRGKVAFNAGNIDFKTQIDIVPTAGTPASSAGFMDQIAELQIPKLELKAPSLGDLDASLPEPIVVKNPASLQQITAPPKAGAAQTSAASVTGRMLIRGVPGPLLTMVNALSGEAPAHKLDGVYAIDEQFAAEPGGAIIAKGRADMNDLVVDGKASPEKAWRILSDLSLDTGSKLLDLRTFSVQATATNSLNMVVKGKVADLGTQQRIDKELTVDLGYDLAPLWQVIFPLMSAEQQKSYKDVAIAGKYQKQFVVTGAYPAGKPFNQAVQSLLAHGDLQVDHLVAKGATLDKADVPIDMKEGIVRVQYFDKPEGQNAPAPIACNGGTVNLAGASVDLRGEHTLVTTPKELKFVTNVSLNPALAAWGLGDVLNNPLFVDAAQATGQLNLTVHNCDQLPVDSLGATMGNAVLDLSIGTLQLGSSKWAKFLPGKLLSSLKGEVPKYHVTIDRGILSQDFTFALLEHKRPIHLTGQVNLATKQMLSTNVELPWALLGVGDQNLQKYLPEGIQIPFTGKTNNAVPALDVNQLVQKYLGQAGQKYLQDQLLGGGKKTATSQPAGEDAIKALGDLVNGKKNTTPSTQPAEQEDPLKALGDLFNRKKKKNEGQ